MACASVILGLLWLAIEVRRGRQQHSIVARLPSTGARVIYRYQIAPNEGVIPDAKRPCPSWLRKILGEDVFAGLAEVSYPRPGTVVTDEDVALLQGLTRLDRLYLGGAQISDASIPYLETLTGLKELHIYWTQITASGARRLQQKLPKCAIRYDWPKQAAQTQAAR
jgi:hypothetical protein